MYVERAIRNEISIFLRKNDRHIKTFQLCLTMQSLHISPYVTEKLEFLLLFKMILIVTSVERCSCSLILMDRQGSFL